VRPIRRCRRIRPILESLGEPVHTPGRMSAKGRRAVGPAGPRRPERPWPGAAFDPRLRHQRHGSGARCRRWRVRARRRRVWRNKRPVGPPINRARTRARAAGFSIARARARERQVFRARAERPNAAGGTSGLTDPLLIQTHRAPASICSSFRRSGSKHSHGMRHRAISSVTATPSMAPRSPGGCGDERPHAEQEQVVVFLPTHDS